MKEQTAAALANANAARLNAQALINAERGRLFQSASVTEEFLVTVKATNYGRSAVQLTYAFVEFEILDKGEHLSFSSTYRDRMSKRDGKYARSEWVMPDKDAIIGVLHI
ncbi:MAG: hypothetical protein ACLQMO_07670 [Acidobacteriaceae bacterium]